MAKKNPTAAATAFSVAMPKPANHLYEIEMEVAPFSRAVAAFDLCLPVWTPGSYFVRDHARHGRELAVTGPSGEPLPVTKTEKRRRAGGASLRGLAVRAGRSG